MLEENKSTPPPTGQAAPIAPTAAAGVAVTRVRLTEQQLESVTKEEILVQWKQQDAFIDTLLSQATSHEGRNHCGSVLMNDCFTSRCLHGTVTLLYCSVTLLTQWLRVIYMT